MIESTRRVRSSCWMSPRRLPVHYDAQLVLQGEGRLPDHRVIAVPVLLLGGSDGPMYLHRTLEALETTLPACAESNSSESDVTRPTTQVSPGT